MQSMQKFTLPLLIIAILLLAFPARAADADSAVDGEALGVSPDELSAESAILIDADTGQVLFAKNAEARRHPASITKVLTAMLVLESVSPNEMLTVSERAIALPYDSSHVALRPGEQLRVDDALYALMLPSANDAANALAEHVSGSIEEFAQAMNRKAAALGATDSHFANPHGLSESDHYTTAKDMALITQAAVKTPGFLRYYGESRYTMSPTNLQPKERPFTNYQYMLVPGMWVYNEEVIGGKVGYTTEARHTMSSAAQRDGRTLVCVVMGSGKDEKFYDTQRLFDYGFEAFSSQAVTLPAEEIAALSVPIVENGEMVGEAGFLAAMSEVSVLIPQGFSAADLQFRYLLPDAVTDEEEAGALAIHLKDEPVPLLEIPLEVDRPVANLLTGGIGAQEKGVLALRWKLILVAALFLLMAFALVIARHVRIQRRIARRKRRLQQLYYQRPTPSPGPNWRGGRPAR